MEEQSSTPFPQPEQPAQQPPFQVPSSVPSISLEALEQLKARAREEAIRITLEQRGGAGTPSMFVPQPSQVVNPNVVYVRRNLTVAELLLMLVLACGIVTGVQFGWKTVSNFIPHIEVKVK